MLCTCGCGQETTIARQSNTIRRTIKGAPNNFLRGHNRRGAINSAESNKKKSQALKGRTGRKHTPEHRAKHSRSLTGREPTYSPFIPNLLVRLYKDKARWYCCDPHNTRRTIAHARAVYEHYVGPVPAGYRVHHKNGDAHLLIYDAPDNLIPLPERWNFIFLPILAEGFNVPERTVTEIYMKVFGTVSVNKLFAAVCSELVKRMAS